MRYSLFLFIVMLANTVHAQVTLPAYQAVQYNVKSVPTLTTDAISNVASTTATAGGNISLAGATSVTARGICWSTSPAPTTASSTAADASGGTGSFSVSMTGLTSVTTYYVRAYAINTLGTAYGNEISFTTFPGIGDTYQGGKIYSMLISTDAGYDPLVPHGMMVSVSNLSGGVKWSNNNNNLNGTNTGGGQANTTAIVSDQGAGTYAAQLCDDYSVVGADGNTYDDWYLPNRGELNGLYNTRGVSNAGYSNQYYWSSSQKVSTTATAKHFGTGNPQDYAKSSNFLAVRAIRAF